MSFNLSRPSESRVPVSEAHRRNGKALYFFKKLFHAFFLRLKQFFLVSHECELSDFWNFAEASKKAQM